MVEILTEEQLKSDPDQQIKAFKKKKRYLVAIDTDGAVVDNMNGKQMLIFHPLGMSYWDLWSIESYYREIGEFVNLFSKTRGCNRFLALQYQFAYLRDRADLQAKAKEAGVRLPDSRALNEYVQSYSKTKKWSPATIEEYRNAHPEDCDVWKLWGWCRAVNDMFPFVSQKIAPFKPVRSCLELMSPDADIIVVSQTPYRDLAQYWVEHKIDEWVALICGQDMGSKADHIEKVKKVAGYADEEVLMIGDAEGDKNAVKKNNGYFFPTNPGGEVESWERLPDAFKKFTANKYRGSFENELIAEFDKLLPEKPPWELPGYDHQSEYLKRQPIRLALRDKYNPGAPLLVM